MRSLETNKARLVWSTDGTTVTKTLLSAAGDRSGILATNEWAARNELRVNRLLRDEPPRVRVPRLVETRPRTSELTLEAIDGEALGPKFPTALSEADLGDLVALTLDLDRYNPRRRWFRRLDVDGRLRRHVAAGVIDAGQAAAVASFADRAPRRWHFAHGDVTARNVLRAGDGHLVLIDWEWAGLYPRGYELAFLWFSLIDAPGGRAAVEAVVPTPQEHGFLLSAVLVQLLHLHMWLTRPNDAFIDNHRRTLDELLGRIDSRLMRSNGRELLEIGPDHDHFTTSNGPRCSRPAAV